MKRRESTTAGIRRRGRSGRKRNGSVHPAKLAAPVSEPVRIGKILEGFSEISGKQNRNEILKEFFRRYY